MRAFSGGLSSLLAGTNVYRTALLIEILGTDGGIYRWTTAPMDITLTNLYSSGGPLVRVGKCRTASDLSVDGLDITLDGKVSVNGIRISVMAIVGSFDDAKVTITRVYMPTFGDTSLGGDLIFAGYVDTVEPASVSVVLKVKSRVARLASNPWPPGSVIAPCSWSLYGTGCGVSKALHTYAKTVAAGSTAALLNYTGSTTTTAPGWVEMSSGQNNGLMRPISSNAGGLAVALSIPLPYAPAIGDTFNIVDGCDRTRTTCLNTFANLARHRGHPDVPPPDIAEDAPKVPPPNNWIGNVRRP